MGYISINGMSKILLLIDTLGQGGAERQMAYLAVQLSLVGNEVRLIKYFPDECAYNDMLSKANVKVETDLKGNNRWRRIIQIYKTVKSWKPDLTIVYKDGTCMAACIARIFTSYNLAVSERNTTQILNRTESVKFHLFRLADYIVQNSISQTKFIRQHFPKLSDKLVTITNMIDTERFKPAQKMPDKKRVIITARLTRQKNVLTFLKALSLSGLKPYDVHFDWFGKIHSTEYYNEISSLQKELNLESLITFHTEGSNKIEEEYRLSTHFCLPSIYEGFPNVLCEAMASGLVCCASNVCDNPYILQNNTLLFDPNNPTQIAATLKDMLSLQKDEFDAIRNFNRNRIEELCSPVVFTQKYLALLK